MAIYTRPDSPYYWMVLERPGQKPLRKSTLVPVDAPTPDQRKALKALAAQTYTNTLADMVAGRLGPAKRPETTFRAYAAWYVANVAAHKRGQTRERSMIRALVTLFGDTPLHAIDRDLAIEKRTERCQQVSMSTANREWDILKHMLGQAVPKYLAASPIAGLARLRTPKRPIRIFTELEEEALLQACRTLEELAIILVARDTLMRLSDVRTLEWANCHGTYIDVIDPKVSPYKVTVTERLREVLDLLPRRGKYLFPARQHVRGERPLSAVLIHDMFVELCAIAKIPQGRKSGGVTFHSLRHTGATRALERGVPIRAVQEAGGWANLKQLQRYGHVTDVSRQMFKDRVGGGRLGQLPATIASSYGRKDREDSPTPDSREPVIH